MSVSNKRGNQVAVRKDSGRGLPVTNTPTPTPPTKPPAPQPPKSEPKK